jgi:hypothetical protein
MVIQLFNTTLCRGVRRSPDASSRRQSRPQRRRVMSRRHFQLMLQRQRSRQAALQRSRTLSPPATDRIQPEPYNSRLHGAVAQSTTYEQRTGGHRGRANIPRNGDNRPDDHGINTSGGTQQSTADGSYHALPSWQTLWTMDGTTVAPTRNSADGTNGIGTRDLQVGHPGTTTTGTPGAGMVGTGQFPTEFGPRPKLIHGKFPTFSGERQGTWSHDVAGVT